MSPKPADLELYSPLSPSACASKLAEAIDGDGAFSFVFASKRPVLGRVKGNTFRLHKRIRYRNSFQTFLRGTFQPHGEGTLVRAKFTLHPFVRVFLPIWFGFQVLFSIIFVVGALIRMWSADAASWHNAWIGLLVPAALVTFGVALVRFGRYLARDEARFLDVFIREVLKAQEKLGPADCPQVKEI